MSPKADPDGYDLAILGALMRFSQIDYTSGGGPQA